MTYFVCAIKSDYTEIQLYYEPTDKSQGTITKSISFKLKNKTTLT